MAISAVVGQSVSATGTGTGVSGNLPSNATVGNLIVAQVGTRNSTPTFTANGSWVKLTEATTPVGGTDAKQAIFYLVVTAASQTVNPCTLGSSVAFSMVAQEFSISGGAWALDVENAQGNASGATASTPSISPDAGIEALIVAAFQIQDNSTWGSGGSIGGVAATQVGTNTEGGLLVYRVVNPTSGSYSGSATSPNNARETVGAIAAFILGVTTYSQTMNGALSPASSLSKRADKNPVGALAPTSALTKLASKALAGALAPTGIVLKRIEIAFAGTLDPTSSVSATRVLLLAVAGALAPTSALRKQANLTLDGALAPTSALTKLIAKILSGALSPVGEMLSFFFDTVARFFAPRTSHDQVRVEIVHRRVETVNMTKYTQDE